MNLNKIYLIIKIISIFGITLAIYLLWEQFFKPSFQPCNINSTVNCDAIINGAVSKTFGIPTPLIGLAGYIFILISTIFKKDKFILAFSIFGLVFCLSIAYIELFKLNVICPVCIICQLLMITIFFFSLILNFNKSLK